jgi:hypothetical protein
MSNNSCPWSRNVSMQLASRRMILTN